MLKQLLLIVCLIGIGCGSNQQPSNSQQPLQLQPSATQGIGPQQFNLQQQAFHKHVKRHVEDPSDFQIVEWGDKNDRVRNVTFSCKAIRVEGGKPQQKMRVVVCYGLDGRIREVVTDGGTGEWWE